MTRPAVSVVMPFAGGPEDAQAAVAALRSLRTEPGDELILVDNAGVVGPAAPVRVVRADAERSPAHARNAGAEQATAEWVLFLDADCRPPAELLDAYFAQPIDAGVGALAGEVRPAPDMRTLAGRYGAARSFLSQRAHLSHPFRPRAVAANLLVRRAAFEQLGGFYEGLRAAEDTDFSWRLQESGWRLELCSAAAVEHRYRTTVRALRRQWRGYAAGRAWLSRRYAGFRPEPAVRRAARRAGAAIRHRPSDPSAAGPTAPAGGGRGPAGTQTPAPAPADGHTSAAQKRFLLLDALLSGEELAGLVLSNRPQPQRPPQAPVQAVLVAEHFPAEGDPLVELASTLGEIRVEASARPSRPDLAAARRLTIVYREDDGAAARVLAVLALAGRHPLRCARDLARRSAPEPTLRALAPAIRRIEHDRGARVLPLGSEPNHALAERMARLAGRPLDAPPRRGRHLAARPQSPF